MAVPQETVDPVLRAGYPSGPFPRNEPVSRPWTGSRKIPALRLNLSLRKNKKNQQEHEAKKTSADFVRPPRLIPEQTYKKIRFTHGFQRNL